MICSQHLIPCERSLFTTSIERRHVSLRSSFPGITRHFDYFHFHKKHDYDTSGDKQASEKSNGNGGSLYRDLEIWKRLVPLFLTKQKQTQKTQTRIMADWKVFSYSVTFFY